MATYNGWANYETWAWKLWMDNDEGSQSSYQELVEDATDQHASRNACIYHLAETLKSEANENAPLDTGAYADLLNAALSAINWYQIAVALVDDSEHEWNEDEDDNAE